MLKNLGDTQWTSPAALPHSARTPASAYTITYWFAALITAWLQRSDELMVRFRKKKNLLHTLFSSSLKGTLNVATDTQTFQLVPIQLFIWKNKSQNRNSVFLLHNTPRLSLLANLNTTSLSVIKLTLLLAFQINYKVTSIIQNFYPLSSYLLQPSYLQVQLSDHGYPHHLSHSQLFGLHDHTLQVTLTTFCRLCACQELLAKGNNKGKKPAHINQNNFSVLLSYTYPERVWSFFGFKKEESSTLLVPKHYIRF